MARGVRTDGHDRLMPTRTELPEVDETREPIPNLGRTKRKRKKTRRGRPRGGIANAKALFRGEAQHYILEALQKAVHIMRTSREEKIILQAIKFIVEHAVGKPTVPVEHSGAVGSYDLEKLTNEQLTSLIAILGGALPDQTAALPAAPVIDGFAVDIGHPPGEEAAGEPPPQSGLDPA